MKNYMRTKQYRELRGRLLEDLVLAGLDTPVYRDQVEEYMVCWCQLQELNDDITGRGTRVEYRNGSQAGVTENKSLGTKIRLRRCMDDIILNLGYRDQARQARQSVAEAQAAEEDDEL